MKGLFLGNISPGGVKLAGNGKNLKTSLFAGKFSSKEKFSDFMSKILMKEEKSKEKLPVIGIVPELKFGVIKNTKNSHVQKAENLKNVPVGKSTKGVKSAGIKSSIRINLPENFIVSSKNVKQTSEKSYLNLLSKPSVKTKKSNLTIRIKNGLNNKISEKFTNLTEKTINPTVFTNKVNVKKGVFGKVGLKKETKTDVKPFDNDNSLKFDKSKLSEVKENDNTSLNKMKVKINKNTLLNEDSKFNKVDFKNNVSVKIISLKKGKTTMEDQVNKVLEKLNLKHNEQRIQGEIKNTLVDPAKQSALIEKVMEAIKIAQKQKPTHRAVLELEPQSLGKIEVKLSINHEQKVEIQVKADNPVVKNMVESSFSSLSSFIGQQNQNAQNGNLSKKNSQFLFEDFEIPAEDQIEIISEIMKDDKAINIIV